MTKLAYIVYYRDKDKNINIEKAFLSKQKATNFCNTEQEYANKLKQDKDFYFKTIHIDMTED